MSYHIELKVLEHPDIDEVLAEASDAVSDEDKVKLRKDGQFNYRNQLRTIVAAPKYGGGGGQRDAMSWKDMDAANDVLDKLRTAKDGDIIELSTSEWTHVKEKVEATQWLAANRNASRFVHDIIDAKDVNAKDEAAEAN